MIKTRQDFNNSMLIGLAVLVNCTGLLLPVLGPDGTLYAAISKEMVLRGDYLNLYAEGADWLDKPHFQFWITALFFKIFGISAFSYKLPALLFVFMGAAYVFLFAEKLYSRKVATWTVIILLTAQHLIMSNNDVRAEPYLVGLIIASVYHFYLAYKQSSLLHLLPASLFAACAVMTKGIFALIPIYGAVFGHLLIIHDYKGLLSFRWLLSFLLVGLFISPELYALWHQFDAHPEKRVFGRQNVSGVRFFFWDSQFGRFMNTGPIKGKGDPTFFIHTTLWAFLPWSILLFAGLIRIIRHFRNLRYYKEWFAFCGAMSTFILFSMSKFQLPHYINILFPFFAIITADYLFAINSRRQNVLMPVQTVLVVICLLAPVVLQFVYMPDVSLALYLPVLLMAAITLYSLFNRFGYWKERIIQRCALGVLTLNVYLNLVLYPDMMQYQSGNTAAKYVNTHFPDVPVVQFKNRYDNAFHFYNHNPVIVIDSLAQLKQLPQSRVLFITDLRDTTLLPENDSIASITHYHISRMTGRFLYHKTRDAELSELVLRMKK